MSIRTITVTSATVVALLASPVTAMAGPADPVDTGAYSSALEPQAEAAGIENDGGTGTLAILAIAGGTLLAGAATGFGGGRAVTRRGAVQS